MEIKMKTFTIEEQELIDQVHELCYVDYEYILKMCSVANIEIERIDSKVQEEFCKYYNVFMTYCSNSKKWMITKK